MEYFTLNNGIMMPMDGIGTFQLSSDEAESAVSSALAQGIRLIDTANAYMNEKAVGRAIKASGISRQDIFLVTKLWPTVYEKENAIADTLARLDTDYIDLLFLHQPTKKWREGYKQIEKACRSGLVKAIGLSNFSAEQVAQAIAEMSLKPQMVQVEAHPYFQQTALKKQLAETGMGLMAWYPLGHGDKTLLQEKTFADLAAKYNKTAAQIILRWHIQSGSVVIPGSKNPQHIKDNYNVFDFSLTADEMASIDGMDKNVRYYNASPAQVEMYAHMPILFGTQK